MKRHTIAILIAWMLFIGVDFLFHASIFAPLWKEDIPAFKSLENLALLIPAGYLSFLLLTLLIGFVFFKIFKTKPLKNEVLNFALLFGALFSLSNFLSLYSFVEVPVKHLLIFNLIYFIEIIVVTFSLYYVFFSTNLKKLFWRSVLIFFLLLVFGIVIQNIHAN